MKIFGFPEMDMIKGIRRSYPPHLILSIANSNKVLVHLEEGYGEDIGFNASDYENNNVHFKNKKEIFSESDYVVCITAPSAREIEMMGEGQTLLAFLHYNTHDRRNKLFYERKIETISLDEIIEIASNRRMVEDLRATSFNAINAALIALKQSWGDEKWFTKYREHVKAYVMGTGKVGANAINALANFRYTGLRQELVERGNCKIEVVALGFRETGDKYFMNKYVLPNADILVDATYRPEGKNHLHIVDKEQLEILPQDTVICDVSADVYSTAGKIHVVKGIQGIPTGKDKEYKMPIFSRDHGAFTDDSYVPKEYQLTPRQRRTTVSSYSWPSFGTNEDRLANVEIYARQIKPILQYLMDFGREGIQPPEDLKTSPLNNALYGGLNPLTILNNQ
jgi:alanine dehydrogenase